jgi:hypothetical protein
LLRDLEFFNDPQPFESKLPSQGRRKNEINSKDQRQVLLPSLLNIRANLQASNTTGVLSRAWYETDGL